MIRPFTDRLIAIREWLDSPHVETVQNSLDLLFELSLEYSDDPSFRDNLSEIFSEHRDLVPGFVKYLRKLEESSPGIAQTLKSTLKIEFGVGHEEFKHINISPVPGITLRNVFTEHTETIGQIAWSPTGYLLASPSFDGTIRVWNIEDGECIAVLKGHEGGVWSVGWSPDGKKLASCSDDGTIYIWNTESWKVEKKLKGHREARVVAWSPDGDKLALGFGPRIRIWDTKTWDEKPDDLKRDHQSRINSISWLPGGNEIVFVSDDTTVKIWNLTPNLNTPKLMFNHKDKVVSLAWASGKSLFASGGGDKVIQVWDINANRLISALEGHTGLIKSLSFSSDGELLASKSSDNTIILWRSDNWSIVATLKESSSASGTSSKIAFHPQLPYLATLGDNDTVIRIWGIDNDVLLGNQTATESVKYTTAKIVLVGDSGVGKTGLGWRLAHGEFKEHSSTHGQQFWVIPSLGKKRNDETECDAVLWDLAGQHIYRPIHSIFLDNVDSSLLLFDPSNRQDPLKGTQFWLEQLKGKGQLPPTVLVGARVDRGALVVSKKELEQFCQRHSISGGYISTSAKENIGIDELTTTLKAQIPWDQMTTTVTTLTFKIIKEYVLGLKEKVDHKGVLVRPAELRQQLESIDDVWRFTDSEMMTAVGHLQNHGYVSILKSSAGEEYILLLPNLLVDLASSIVLLADKSPRELGAISETALFHDLYEFDEVKGLEKSDQQILLAAAILRFLEHNICFRETVSNDTLLIFPGLIKQKRPLQDEFESVDDVSYIVHGRVENLYAALVVLLGYTSMFTRTNQWQNQAQYEMGEDEICGFRLLEEREGEIELVLYYNTTMPIHGRDLFKGLFESFLYKRDVDINRFPPVFCRNTHRQERAIVTKRLREGKLFLFCDECGEKVLLPQIERPSMSGSDETKLIQWEEALARLRSTYEANLLQIKSFRRDRVNPRCLISYVPAQSAWVERLSHDLRDAGVFILGNETQVTAEDIIILVASPEYRLAWEELGATKSGIGLIRNWASESNEIFSTAVPLLLDGDPVKSLPPEMQARTYHDFRDPARYSLGLFDLVLNLYAIPADHRYFSQLRQDIRKYWESIFYEANQ